MEETILIKVEAEEEDRVRQRVNRKQWDSKT